MGGAALGTAGILVVWFYNTGRDLVFQSIVTGMKNMADIVSPGSMRFSAPAPAEEGGTVFRRDDTVDGARSSSG